MTSQPRQGETRNDDEVDERSLESTEADFSEQHAETTSEQEENNEEWLRRARVTAEREASVADAMEQMQEVEYDEDEYR